MFHLRLLLIQKALILTFFTIYSAVQCSIKEKRAYFLNLSTSDSQNSYSITYQAIGRLFKKKIPHQNVTFSYVCS